MLNINKKNLLTIHKTLILIFLKLNILYYIFTLIN